MCGALNGWAGGMDGMWRPSGSRATFMEEAVPRHIIHARVATPGSPHLAPHIVHTEAECAWLL